MNYLSAVFAVFHVVFGKRAAEDCNIRVFWKCKNISEICEAMFLKTADFITDTRNEKLNLLHME